MTLSACVIIPAGERVGGRGSPGLSVHDFGATGDGRTDDTAAIQRAVDAARVSQVESRVFLPAGVYRTTAPIRLYPGVRVIGVNSGEAIIGTQVRAYHDGAVFEFDETFGAPWFHHGGVEKMSIKTGPGFRPAAGIDVYQAGENCIFRELSLEDLGDGIVLGDEVDDTYQVSATIEAVSGQRNSGAVVRVRRGIQGGMVVIRSLSADANGQALRVDGSGASFSIVVTGLKTEAPQPAQHAPAILLADTSLSLTVLGGWVTAGKSTGTEDVVRITGAASAPRVVLLGVGVLNYVNLVHDVGRDRRIPVLRDGVPCASTAYNMTGDMSGSAPGFGCAVTDR